MGTDKDSADKVKADVERVEVEEDEARAKTGQRPAKPAQATARAELRSIGPSLPPDTVTLTATTSAAETATPAIDSAGTSAGPPDSTAESSGPASTPTSQGQAPACSGIRVWSSCPRVYYTQRAVMCQAAANLERSAFAWRAGNQPSRLVGYNRCRCGLPCTTPHSINGPDNIPCDRGHFLSTSAGRALAALSTINLGRTITWARLTNCALSFVTNRD
jgi:hypothetical protein